MRERESEKQHTSSIIMCKPFAPVRPPDIDTQTLPCRPLFFIENTRSRTTFHPFIHSCYRSYNKHPIHIPIRSEAIRFVCNLIVLIFSISSIASVLLSTFFLVRSSMLCRYLFVYLIGCAPTRLFHSIITIHFTRPFPVNFTSNRSSVLRYFHTQTLSLAQLALHNQFVIFLFTDDAININTMPPNCLKEKAMFISTLSLQLISLLLWVVFIDLFNAIHWCVCCECFDKNLLALMKPQMNVRVDRQNWRTSEQGGLNFNSIVIHKKQSWYQSSWLTVSQWRWTATFWLI